MQETASSNGGMLAKTGRTIYKITLLKIFCKIFLLYILPNLSTSQDYHKKK